jgi:signal transduction histidine kinase
LFQKVRTRIALLSLALVIIIYTISSFAIYTIVRQVVLRQIDARLHGLARAVVEQYDETGNIAATGAFLPHGTYLFLATDGAFILRAPSNLESALWSIANHAPIGTHYVDLKTSTSHYRVFYILQGRQGHPNNILMIAADDHSEVSVLRRLKTVIFFVGIAGMALSTLAGFYLAQRVLRPIRSAWQRQLEFVADASHELRTPLAVIQSNLDIAMGHTDESVIDNLEWLNNAHSETRRLSKLVQDLLTLARSDSEKVPLQLTVLSLAEMVERVQDLYGGIVEMAGIELEIQISPEAESLQIRGDADRLQQLLLILLDNARKFTPSGGRITVRLSKLRSTALLQVADTGRGIAAEDLPRVFDRFFTADLSRTRDDEDIGGTGLGLSIAEWIVEKHRGKITMSSPGLGQGATVSVELPTI